MDETASRVVAIVGLGAVLPDAPNVAAFWDNVKQGRYSISDVSPDRWDPALYYDPNPKAPNKTYSKIGGWVREYPWEPAKWRIAIPPRVVDSMDGGQKWAIACTREALEDYGYTQRPFDRDRTAVILGNAMGGERHYLTALRIYFPEYARELSESSSFAALPAAIRSDITREWRQRMERILPEITEDSMPGELANCTAGRVANVFNFHGPNFTADAACASAMAAINSAVEGLAANEFDVAIAGGIDRNMGASSFVKFCKIGALSGTGSRPYAEGADGFVMGEGAAIFILKRLADAERDKDKIYAVVRGIGASSDGKGKGITAPNPIGQKLAVTRGWMNSGLSPETVSYFEGHGTSTSVGDLVEVQSMVEVLGGFKLPVHSVPLGSVKSNIGHLKGAAGAAGMLKATLALHDKVVPPSINCGRPNPNVDFDHCPLYVNTELKPWTATVDGIRRAGVSAFGFGGTNWHAVLEEYIPGRLKSNGKRSISVPAPSPISSTEPRPSGSGPMLKPPLRGALVIGGSSPQAIEQRLRPIHRAAEKGTAPALSAPAQADLNAAHRLAIDYADAADLADKAAKAIKALAANQPAIWKALRAQGIFYGQGPAPKVAFLYTGQGSQYANMLKPLCDLEPLVRDTFAEADRVMTPLLEGKPLTEFIFIDERNPRAVAKADDDLRQTEITQPAVLAVDMAITRLLAAYGIQPDFTMGHSLGEYGALVASGALPFDEALQAVSARGRGMARVALEDNGKMAAVFAPLPEIERILKTIDGYVVIANINSGSQAVIGGASKAIERAVEVFIQAGYNAVPLSVSHAFHTSIVAPASEPLRAVLERLHLQPPQIKIVTNVTGEFYPMGQGVAPQMVDLLARQVASPVQFVKGLETLYRAGARLFIEVGPKKALQGFAEDALGPRGDAIALFTNHPKFGDLPAFNQALCGLYAAGLGAGQTIKETEPLPARRIEDVRPADLPVTITGAALGLPGTERVFDDDNIRRILDGEQFIDVIPTRLRRAIVDKHITRLVKSENGGPVFETIDKPADVIKLAGRGGALDLENEFGISSERVPALDRVTQLAIGAGIDALRDAGIPLVLHYKTTTRGTKLPDRWGLPDEMRDDTGVIFASCWPGFNSFAEYNARYYADRARRDQLAMLETLRSRATELTDGAVLKQEMDRRISDLKAAIEKELYILDRRFLFRVLAMGHSQFAELIGARGPNTAINGACASTTQAVALAEDWIRAGRCRRVIIVAADDVTSDHLIEWMGAGFLASGAAATDAVVEEAALPFDRRRHGMIIGMGAAALVVESRDSIRERGLQPICEVLSAVNANSAFHGTRLDVQHICQIMEGLVKNAETRNGFSRNEAAPKLVFVSHETYTPARGGSASAEVNALRKVFGETADSIVITNTKGFTGHAMGAGIEDVVAVKALETGCVPPVANFKEVDPELGPLNLSKGGAYPVEYALRLGAGFGSQIGMTLLRRACAVHPNASTLGYAHRIEDQAAWNTWLARIAGAPTAELEVVRRTLRVRDAGAKAPVIEAEKQKLDLKAPPPPPPAIPALNPDRKGGAHAPAQNPDREGGAHAPVKDKILDLVVEKTGYPRDMLALDLDLEADLGVDTVKQAEMFASIRETYNIPRDPNLKLRDFPTLAHVIRFVHDRRPDLAAPAAAIPVMAIPVATPPTEERDPVQNKVLDLVVEKTGYPRDMLDLDLDLEADLGVDTVKQAEMFASIRETYNIPRDPNLKLRDFPTLAHVIRFVHDRRPDLAAPAAAAPIAAAAPVAAPSKPESDPVRDKVLDLVVEKTGYPRDMLDLDLDLEADLGVDTVKQAEMFASIRETYNIPRDPNLKLRDFPTLAHVIRFVHDRRPDLAAPAAAIPVMAIPVATPPTEERDPVQNKVLDLVVEKTGYPRDMLGLDLDLEADLGVDTVKQAEMFASIRETYNIPGDPNLKLRDFPTLAHVIRFVHDRRPDLAAPAAAAPRSAAAPPAEADLITHKVLEIVAEKTGYPREMLDLDLDLEADLGIDTVKQAEMFASVRQTFGIPRDTELKLRDFPTLAHVIQFARERRKTESAAVLPHEARPIAAGFEAADRIARRAPIPVLRPPTTFSKPTGVSLEPGRRVLIASDKGGVGDALAELLRQKGIQVLGIEEMTNGPVHGVYWLPALDDEGSLDQMDLASWREALQVRVKALYTTMRTLYEQIAPAGTFFVSATQLGGQHGYNETGATSPLGGAVVGFTKTYKRERPDALVKAVDFETGHSPQEVAEALIEETLYDPGAVEIGRKAGLRWMVGMEEQPVANGRPGMTFDNNTVFAVTGAAGSIVSAITADLAAASGGTFYLLDLVPEPAPDDPDLALFVTDKDALKRDLFTRMQARGERATPAMIEKQLAALERALAARTAIDAVRAAGGVAHYFSVNLTDPGAVAKVVETIRERSGRIGVLLHAAGIERSHFLPGKEPAEFDLVFDVKADGWFNLLHSIGDMPLGAAVAFSSIAGRFGNAGQADYSAANDLLCKIVSSFRTSRPATRGIAIDWTAWGGIGMATRGSIPKMMELAGITMLPPDAGIPWIRRELTLGNARGEVIVAGELGVLLKEWDPSGGIEADIEAQRPMIGKAAGVSLSGVLSIETTLDPTVQPFLFDHRIDGTPVLPGVMGMEAFAEAAASMLPGWRVAAVENIDFLAPFKFYRDEPRTLTLETVLHPSGDDVLAECRLTGRRQLPNQTEPQDTIHFTGRVRLTKQPLERPAAITPPRLGEPGAEAAQIYRLYFHGPAYRVLERTWTSGDQTIGQMAHGLPENHRPPELQTLIAPRLIELCFQTVGIWEMSVQHRMGLPLHVDRITLLRAPESCVSTFFAVITPPPDRNAFDAEVVDAEGDRYVELSGYRTVPFAEVPESDLLKAVAIA